MQQPDTRSLEEIKQALKAEIEASEDRLVLSRIEAMLLQHEVPTNAEWGELLRRSAKAKRGEHEDADEALDDIRAAAKARGY